MNISYPFLTLNLFNFSFALTIVSIALKGREKLLDYLHRLIVKGKKSLNTHGGGGRLAPSMGRVSHG